MRDYTQTLHVDGAPEQVFAAVVDPEFQSTRFMKVEPAEEAPEGVGTTHRYHYRLFGIDFGGGSYEYSEYEPGRRFTWEFSTGPETLLTGGPVSSTWTFEAADGGTDVTIHPEFRTRIPVVNDIARGIMMWSWRMWSLPRFGAEIRKRLASSS